MKRVYLVAGATIILVGSNPGLAQLCCGDCNGSGETTIDEIVDVVGGALGDCTYRTTAPLLATGQTIPYGEGSDGQVQAGIPLAYRDNGDGTVTDLNTGLMWEKKDDSGGIHDWDNRYTWSLTGTFMMSGTIATEFLSALNGANGSGDCFAGYCDWRIPNARELHSIVSFQGSRPAVDSVFQRATCKGCSDITSVECSCTSITPHWTSSTIEVLLAWTVRFWPFGATAPANKEDELPARAVRGGL